MSTFKELSKLISVSDICESFIAVFDSKKQVKTVWSEWSIDLCVEKGLDPMEQIALIRQNNKIVGWLSFEMLETDKTLDECMDTISGDILISSDTPLLEAILTVCNSDKPIFLILKGNKFIGYLHYSHFYKLPFRMCLFSLLIDIETIMLEITKRNPVLFLNKLSEKRMSKAKELYRIRRFSLDDKNNEYISKLIDCTTFIDKFTMLKKSSDIVKACPNIKDDFTKLAEKIRNLIAHPDGEELGELPIKKENLLAFIQWAEEFQTQLYNYLRL